MSDSKGVLVYGEVVDGKLSPITTELLGCACRLAGQLNEESAAVLVGSNVAGLAQEAIAFGAGKVYVIDDALFKNYQGDACAAVMEKVARQVNPRVLLIGQTSTGRDLAPRLAFRLNTTATLDCIDVTVDPQSRQVLQTKPVYGGNARAMYTGDTFPQVVTVRAKAMAPLDKDVSRLGQVVTIAAGIDPSVVRAKFIEKVKQEESGVTIRLEDAKVVVSGGRGIGGPEGFKQLDELARVLKGAMGASRPPCDSGWVPTSCQVGLTGRLVAPDLYVAVAISGSSQHMAGCSGARAIVAINKDPESNIFREACYGVVGDWKKVLPAFTQKIKELVGKEL